MEEFNDMELKGSHKEYEAKIKNLEGIIDKLNNIFDMSKYEHQLSNIEQDFNKDPSFSNEMMFEGMQLTYESLICTPYIKRLDSLTQELEADLMPFYELYLLGNLILEQINEKTKENLSSIIENTINLINLLNRLNTHNKDEKKVVVSKAYEVIYSAMLYEAIFGQTDILDYINRQNIAINNENLGRLLSKDLKKMRSYDLMAADLENINKDGLGYDFLTPEIIQKVANAKDSAHYYQDKKQEVIKQLQEENDRLNERKNNLLKKAKLVDERSVTIKVNKRLLATRIFSFVLLPITLFTTGHIVGKKTSESITEYKTTTKTFDLDTGKLIGEPKIIYDENETTYVATVTIYDPWMKSPTGSDYIRNAVAYEYITPKNAGKDFHITKENLENNVREKYRFTEPKETVDSTDSLVNSEIIVTETFQDKTDTHKSTKFVIPFSLVGLGLGVAVDILLILQGFYSLETIKSYMKRISKDSKRYNEESEKVKKELIELQEDVLELQEKFNEAVKKYGQLEDRPLTLDLRQFNKNRKSL